VSARYTTRRTGQWWGLKVQTSPEFAPALLDLLHEVAGVGVPTYGEISFDNAGHLDHATSFEHNLGRFPWRTVVDSATTLRGYSWLTIAAASIVEAIGGPAVLRSSAAFVHVEQLPGGSYWLQATPTLAEYGPAEAAAVQAALAPALQPGLPRPDLDGEAPHRLALVDAHPDRPVARHSDDGDIFGHRVDTRDSTAHGIALAVRMSTLKSRFRKALIWGATSHEAGPHLVCWGARAGEVWVWQVEPADEADGGLEIARDLRPVLSAVALDPLSAGMRVRPGPTFAELGLPAVESAADAAFGAFGSVQVADAGPGRQVRQALEQAPRSDDQNRTARVVARAVKLREAVLASAPPVRERRLDRGTYAGWLNQP
jgi:hypothetical protein